MRGGTDSPVARGRHEAAEVSDDPELTTPRAPTGDELLLIAQAEAQAGRPVGMLEALGRSGFLDGLVRRLERQWAGRLPRPEIEECVGAAVDSAYHAVSNGRHVANLGAWLWKAAANIAV